MNDVSRRGWSAAVAVFTVGFAVVALAGPCFAEAATFAKPAHAGSQGMDPAARAAGNAKAGTGEGIVQSVSAKAIVLRELDGRTVTVPVASSTQVFVDGKRASLRDVRAGYDASSARKAGKSARVLQAFDLLSPHAVSVGVVDSVSTGVVVVTWTGGTTVSVPVNARTRVLVDGKRATLAAVKAGYTVVIDPKDSKSNKPAHELRFLRPV
jgi:hypothetical protein